MKTDFNVHVSVELGVTPELVKLVTAIMGGRDTDEKRGQAPLDPPSRGEEAATETRAAAKPRLTTTGESAPTTEDEAAAIDGRSGDTENTMSGGDTGEAANNGRDTDTGDAMSGWDAEDKPKELTEEDIRMAMHKTRQRIEGENYKEETDGEGYTKYHRKLTAEFKRIAAALGADKPSALPAEQREAFIRACEGLKVTKDGTIEEELPF